MDASESNAVSNILQCTVMLPQPCISSQDVQSMDFDLSTARLYWAGMPLLECEIARTQQEHQRHKNITLALGRMVAEEGRMGVPSGAITKLALPQALLAKDRSKGKAPDPDLDPVRLGRDRAVPNVSEGRIEAGGRT